MTGRISFPMAELEKVVAQFQQEGVTLTATMDCLFDASLYQDKKIVDKDGLTEQQAKKANKPWWPDSEKIDKSKLTPKLMIVGDHGVYVMDQCHGIFPTLLERDFNLPELAELTAELQIIKNIQQQNQVMQVAI